LTTIEVIAFYKNNVVVHQLISFDSADT